MKRLSIALLIAMTSFYSYGGRLSPAERALQDVFEKNGEVLPGASDEELERAIAPCITQAKESFREIRTRFEKGLPSGSLLLVFRRLPEEDQRIWEGEVYLVESFSGSQVEGYEWMGTAHKSRDDKKVAFPDRELIDWILANRNGTIEGNRMVTCMKKVKDEKRGTP